MESKQVESNEEVKKQGGKNRGESGSEFGQHCLFPRALYRGIMVMHEQTFVNITFIDNI